ncbi:hypothetical protein FQV27_04525 [Paracoccus aurantiacus]|uniref:Uncharacterized protein n=1 Tax=Paracoccus aurantiacus TaxID=2599412 RepID=A0A5C6S9N4_9RHOB|nr:hypothetical protein [Paracoccus aurantiacus]TXB71118.1 hypothetical protein FQV27_04525 [Paracoccus aurantiacus]
MTEAPKDIPLGRFLHNASMLLDMTVRDAHGMQLHLAEFVNAAITASATPGNEHAIDLTILQSLDRMTQVLSDLSAVFLAASQNVSDTSVPDWQHILAELKVKDVGQSLTHGSRGGAAASNVELF